MFTILAWIVWGVLLLVTLGFSYGIIRSLQMKKSFSYAILIQAILFWIIISVFYFTPQLSKYHIIWVAPLIFILVSVLFTRRVLNKPR